MVLANQDIINIFELKYLMKFKRVIYSNLQKNENLNKRGYN